MYIGNQRKYLRPYTRQNLQEVRPKETFYYFDTYNVYRDWQQNIFFQATPFRK